MKIGSMFSGAGGLDLAALELFPGSSMAWHCEVDPAASKVLAHHWPEIPNLGDVTGIDWTAVESVDVLTGGFPCQDVSLAGRRAGLADGTRSGLWVHMATAIAALRPLYVLIENVKGLLSASAVRGVESNGGGMGDMGSRPVLRALGAVLGDLADLGFDAEWTMLRASDIGFCHHRARVFILAYPADSDEARSQRPQSTQRHDVSTRRDSEPVALLPTPQVADITGGHRARSGDRSNELLLPGLVEAYAAGSLLPTPRASDDTKGGPNQRGSSGDLMLPSAVMSLLPTPNASDGSGGGQHPDRRQGHSQQLIDYALTHGTERWGDYETAIRRQESVTRPAPSPTEPNTKGNQRLSASFAEWMMGWPSGWATDPEIRLSRTEQLKAIGNGVVPPQAVAAFRYLLDMSEVA